MNSTPGEPPTESTTSWHGLRLHPFQQRAIDALRAGHDVLVAAPTGAGKTLVAEVAIETAVERGRRVVYTAPIKALSNQKYRDFRDERGIDVGLCTGDVTIDPDAQVLVMTTEILRNAIFENPRWLHDVDFVVFDEVHYLDERDRGMVWEESLIFTPPEIRFVCLSATIANMDELGAWIAEIRGRDIEIVESRERPVPLDHRLWAPRVGLFPASQRQALRKKLVARERKRRGGPRGRRGRDRRRRGPREAPDISPLLDELQEHDLLPALVFSFSRRECERLARRQTRRRLLSDREGSHMRALVDREIERFELDERRHRELIDLVRRGIGYHHAGLLPVEKELVERLFTSGLLRLVFATETFALGINMPARTVVFPSLRKFDGISVDWLRTRDYMQMAGRAGRQGIDDAGLVVSMVTTRELDDAPLARLFSERPEPILSRFRLSYSTILHLVEHAGPQRVFEAWEKSFNRFQHSGGSPKARDKNRKKQRRIVSAHIDVLRELGYLDERDRLTPRGRIARQIPGYELQTAELVFDGVLEGAPPRGLAGIFVALIYEERRPGARPWIPQRMFGGLRKRVDRVLRHVQEVELAHDLPQPSKPAEWGLLPALLAWGEGAELDELADECDAQPGDVVRVFRMALQLMRQVARAVADDEDLADRLRCAVRRMDRDEVDARRQLELGRPEEPLSTVKSTPNRHLDADDNS